MKAQLIEVRRLLWVLAVATFLPSGTALCAMDPTLSVSVVRTNQGVIVSWGSVNSVPYQVEASSDLNSWTSVGPMMTGNGSTLLLTNSIITQSNSFFRVARLFPAAPGTAVFNPATGLLTIVCDNLHHVINVANDGTGVIIVTGSGGTVIPITGGVATTANTVLIQILGTPGDDQISLGNGLVAAHIFGSGGNDTLTGGDGNDTIVSGPGPGNNVVRGGRGSDVIFLGGSSNTVAWNPGDGSDIIQGLSGNNTLVFNGANVSEKIDLSANGTRLRLTRDVANITMDVAGVQTVDINALGGADTLTVNPLTGIGVTQVNIDLASPAGSGTGDGAADSVVINGTAGADTFNIGANGSAVEVSGLGTLVHVTGGELANDRIAVNGVGGDTVNVNGTDGPDLMQILPSPVTNCVRVVVSTFTVPVDVTGALTLVVNGLGGADTITGASGLAALGIPMVLNGGDGDNTITGGDGNDIIISGPGNNNVSGGRGNDSIILGSGTNFVSWSPGDGSDTIDGQGTNNALVFNAANISEKIDLSANGTRLRLTRDVANITMDVAGVQTVDINALGGADTLTVNPLIGTGVTQVNIDLASPAGTGTGDGAADSVVINGTAGADEFNIGANGNAVEVTGLGTLVHVTGGELANDRIAVTGVGNDTVNVNGTAGPDNMQILPSPVAGFARVVVSGFTVPVDVTGSLTLVVNGLGGADTITGQNGLAGLGIPMIINGGDGDNTITGGDGNDTIISGPGNNLVSGGRGNDNIFLGSGTNTVVWNPGDGSDTIQGQGGGNNTLVFNGANINEKIDLSANGTRLRLTRDIASITMDVDGVQTVDINASGGADTLTVNDLTGTAVSQVNIDLSSPPGSGTGDGAADSVIVNGTAAPDTINVTASGSAVNVSGLPAGVQITGEEVANDVLTINGMGGVDTFNVGSGVTSLIGLVLNQ
jgi:Ca2+-binding RTX toxin-like protein